MYKRQEVSNCPHDAEYWREVKVQVLWCRMGNNIATMINAVGLEKQGRGGSMMKDN